MIRRNKISALILIYVMIISLFSSVGVTVAAEQKPDVTFRYTMKARSADTHEAGTAGTLTGHIFFYALDQFGNWNKNGQEIAIIGLKNNDGNAKGSYKLVSGSTDSSLPPWRVSAMQLSNNSDDAYKCLWMAIYVEIFVGGDKKGGMIRLGEFYYPKGSDAKEGGKWIETKSSSRKNNIYYDNSFGGNGVQTRNSKSILGWDKFDGEAFIEVDESSGVIEQSLANTSLSSGRYHGGDVWALPDAPTMKFAAYGISGAASQNGVESEMWNDMVNSKVAEETKTFDSVTGFSIKKDELASYMNTNRINVIKLVTTLKFPWPTFSDAQHGVEPGCFGKNLGSDTFTRTFTITRKALEVTNVRFYAAVPKYHNNALRLDSADGKRAYLDIETTPNALYTNSMNNNFFNDNTYTIAALVTLSNDQSMLNSGLYKHINRDDMENMTQGKDNEVYLEVGPHGSKQTIKAAHVYKIGNGQWRHEENDNLLRTHVTSNGHLFFFFPIDNLEMDSGADGITLQFKNFTLGGYSLTTPQTDYTETDKKGNYNYYEEKYKIDTITPAIEATLLNSEDELNRTDGWMKTARVKYSVSEDLAYTDGDAQNTNNSMQGELQYSLYHTDEEGMGQSALRITSKSGGSTVGAGELITAPAVKEMNDTVTPINIGLLKDNEGEYETTVVVTARDKAGHWYPSDKGIIDLKLDNMAPRVKHFITKKYEVDNTQTVTVDFRVQEATKTAKIYYTFSGSSTPPERWDPQNPPSKVTGPMDAFDGTWAFVEQDEQGDNVTSDTEPYSAPYSVAAISDAVVAAKGKAENNFRPVFTDVSNAEPISAFIEDLRPGYVGSGNVVSYKLKELQIATDTTKIPLTQGFGTSTESNNKIVADSANTYHTILADEIFGKIDGTGEGEIIAVNKEVNELIKNVTYKTGTGPGELVGGNHVAIVDSVIREEEIINQDGDPVSGAAVKTLKEGEAYNGYIHYYSVDALGNESEFTTAAINAKNDKTLEVDIAVETVGSNRPHSNHDIRIITPKNQAARVQWQWLDSNGNTLTPMRDYNENNNDFTTTDPSKVPVGSGRQYDSNGKAILLDGNCILKVQLVDNDGTPYPDIKAEEMVPFDNAAPKIYFTTSSGGSFRPSQTVYIRGEDASGIAAAKVTLIQDNGNDENGNPVNGSIVPGYELIDLPNLEAGTSFSVTDVLSGAYRLSVLARDRNGIEITANSQNFYIRNIPPKVNFLNVRPVSVGENGEITQENGGVYNGVPVINKENYQVTLDVLEHFTSPTTGQLLHYRAVTENGAGPWITMDNEMTPAIDVHRMTPVITNPTALKQGYNDFEIETIITPQGVSPDDYSQNLIAKTRVVVLYDTNAPSVRIKLDEASTNTQLTGSLRVGESESKIEKLEVRVDNPKLITLNEIDDNDYEIIVTGNVSGNIAVIDAAGNEAIIPINITCFDFAGPGVNIIEPPALTTVESGARKDASMMIEILDVDKGRENLRLFLPMRLKLRWAKTEKLMINISSPLH